MAGLLKTAFVIGYTGAVGREVVKSLAESKRFEKIVLIGRRKVEYDTPDLQALEQRVIDYEKLDELKETFSGFDVAFCCLGTTRKEAGSAEAFRHVDYDYVHQIALHCKESGTKHFHYVSSAGADKNSFFLYPKTKGQIEEALSKMMFPRLSIYRPKVLYRGDRSRGIESLFLSVIKPIEYLSPHSMTTGCDTVADAMLNNCDTVVDQPTEILFNQEIYKLSEMKTKSSEQPVPQGDDK